METLIQRPKSIIPSLDFSSLEELDRVVKETCSLEGVGAYKIGIELGLTHSIPVVVKRIREHTSLPIIYDHQKAATDIPEMGTRFVQACKDVDGIILFPQAGPNTAQAWIDAVTASNKTCIVGGEMTHPGYLAQTGGFINDDGPNRIYTLAAQRGVTHFVVPGTKPDRIAHYKELLTSLGCTPVLTSPGIGTQGGQISECSKAAGEFWHAYIGRSLYQADDIQAAAKSFIAQL